MKRLAIAITASVIMLAGCQSDILQVEEMKKGEAPGANLKSAGLTCVNVREQKTFGLGFVEMDFKELGEDLDYCLQGLFDKLYDEFAEFHTVNPDDPMGFRIDQTDLIVTGLGAPFVVENSSYIFSDYGEDFADMRTASIVVHQYPRGNGAIHGRLFHLFISPRGAFLTFDEFVQTPHNRHLVSRINNKMEIVAGTGIFEDVTGRIINNGSVQHLYIPEYEMIVPVSLEANLHGRICY